MGNSTSCLFVKAQTGTVKLVDLHGNLRFVNVPITAAELMLEEPGHTITCVDDLRSTSRFTAMKAEDELCPGRVYFLVPLARLHHKLLQSELALIESACEKGRRKRRSSNKFSPAVELEGFSKNSDVQVRDDICLSRKRLRHWRPALEPISEV